MKKTLLLVALCLSMMTMATPLAGSTPAKTAVWWPITVVSPQNVTYNVTATPFSLTLSFHISNESRLLSWIGYSLDDQPYVEIQGNTTIPVGPGSHTIAVNATDTLGGKYASETVQFLVHKNRSDLNGDGYVDTFDAVILAAAYGSTPKDPSRWNPKADLAYPFERIDIYDLVTLVSDWEPKQ